MITGDHPLTAFSISKELGLCDSFDEVATGEDVKKVLFHEITWQSTKDFWTQKIEITL